MPRIAQLRNRLNTLDAQLVELLAERMLVSRELAPLKQARGMETLQPAVWEGQLAVNLKHAEELELDTGFVREVFELIHQQSVAIQLNELQKNK